MRGVDVASETLIGRPIAEVAGFAGDPVNAPRWYENIKAVEWKTDPPLRVGSRVAFLADFLGRRLSYTYEVTELEPGRRLVMRTAEGPFPMETVYEWERRGESTTWMRLRNRGRPSGFAAVMSPFLSMAMRRANRKDLRRLKQLLEGRTTGR
jgi:uncharacterized membrane protein